jgi:lysozyme
LRNDIDEAYRGLALYGWFTQLDVPRQNVLIEMAFNLGVRGLLGFKKMIEAIQSKNYKLASTEMLDSTWAKQVKSRAARMAKRMELGID